MAADPVRWTSEDDDQLHKHEAIIDNGLQSSFVSLLAIRNGNLYRKGYSTFEAYCLDRWGISRSRAYQLIDAAKVAENVSTMVDTPLPSERQARPLAPLPAPQQREAWSKAVDSAPNGKPTAKHVERAVAEVKATRTVTKPVQASITYEEPVEPEPDPHREAARGMFTPTNGNSHKQEEPVETLVLAPPDDPMEYGFTGIDNAIQKVLGVVCAVEDFGIPNVAVKLSHRRRLGLAMSLDNLTTKLTAWSDYLKGEQP
jgi:hypothetical protein